MNLTREDVWYSHEFRIVGCPGAGYGFECDYAGNIDKKKCEFALENYQLCLTGEVRGEKVVDLGIKEHVQVIHLCPCGSGKDRHPMHDARGIFCCYHCHDCYEEKKGKYRPEIFTDANYFTEEEV